MPLKSLLASCLILLGALSTAFAEATWLTNIDEAKKVAIKEGKPLLLFFPQGDWSPLCKTLHQNIFSTEEFAKEAAGKYVLFQRSVRLAPERAQSSELMKKYNWYIPSYPTVLLVDAKTGEVLGRTVGFGGWTPRQYLDKLASFLNRPDVVLREEIKRARRSAAPVAGSEQRADDEQARRRETKGDLAKLGEALRRWIGF
jgi:protein disulfide-isomerase